MTEHPIEVKLVFDVLMGLLVLQCALGLWAYAMLGSLPIHNANIQQLNSTLASTKQASQNLNNSFCKSVDSSSLVNQSTNIKVSNRCNVQNSEYWGLGVVINIVWGLGVFLINLLLLIVTYAIAIVVILFVIIPGLLSSADLGPLGSFAAMFFQIATLVSMALFGYIISAMLGLRKVR